MVSQHKFTSLDRAIARNKGTADLGLSGQTRSLGALGPYVLARLRKLETMGLAAATGLNQWRVRQDSEPPSERCSVCEISKDPGRSRRARLRAAIAGGDVRRAELHDV